MEVVAALAKGDDDYLGTEAQRYLDAFTKRADTLSNAQGKLAALGALATAIKASQGALVFTMRVATAERSAALLEGPGVRAAAIHGKSAEVERENALDRLRAADLDVVAAPRILDEGSTSLMQTLPSPWPRRLNGFRWSSAWVAFAPGEGR